VATDEVVEMTETLTYATGAHSQRYFLSSSSQLLFLMLLHSAEDKTNVSCSFLAVAMGGSTGSSGKPLPLAEILGFVPVISQICLSATVSFRHIGVPLDAC